jgi:hypothetical protein
MSGLLSVLWVAGLLLVIPRAPFGLTLWARMPASEREFALAMGALCFGNLVLAFRSWRSYVDARKQSRLYAPAVAGVLREKKMQEAIKISDRYSKSHLARTVKVGLMEFSKSRSRQQIGATDRAMDRAREEVVDECRRTQRKLAVSRIATLTIGGAFILFTTDVSSVWSVRNAFAALGLTLYAAAPAFFAQRSGFDKSEALRVEMENSQSEVIDYLIKISAVTRR